MTFAAWLAAAYSGLALLIHIATIAIAAVRCRTPARPLDAPEDAPGVTVVRPVCGLDNFVEATLRTSFMLDYPRYEVIFCVVAANDPVIPLIRSLMAEYPNVSAKLLIGDDRISANPKLNNCVKGWDAARYDWVVLSDSNVLLPRDYIQRLLATWQDDTGVVSAPPIGSHPVDFWAGLECAFLNTYQARWQYVADTIGLGFAQGKTLFYRRAELDAAGGMHALATEAAEDAATTKVVRAMDRRVRLIDAPFRQPLGLRRRADVWSRQVRWAQLRRSTFGRFYMLEVASGAVLPLVFAAFAAWAAGLPVASTLALFGLVWYGSEMALCAVAGWHLPLLYPVHAALRDLLLPVLWFIGFSERAFVWRGNQMRLDDCDRTETA